jgi:hypothetical protein
MDKILTGQKRKESLSYSMTNCAGNIRRPLISQPTHNTAFYKYALSHLIHYDVHPQ